MFCWFDLVSVILIRFRGLHSFFPFWLPEFHHFILNSSTTLSFTVVAASLIKLHYSFACLIHSLPSDAANLNSGSKTNFWRKNECCWSEFDEINNEREISMKRRVRQMKFRIERRLKSVIEMELASWMTVAANLIPISLPSFIN